MNLKTSNENLMKNLSDVKPWHKSTQEETLFMRNSFVNAETLAWDWSLSAILGCKTVPVLSVNFLSFWMKAKNTSVFFDINIYFFWQPIMCWNVSSYAASPALIYCQCSVYTRVLKFMLWLGADWCWLITQEKNCRLQKYGVGLKGSQTQLLSF